MVFVIVLSQEDSLHAQVSARNPQDDPLLWRGLSFFINNSGEVFTITHLPEILDRLEDRSIKKITILRQDPGGLEEIIDTNSLSEARYLYRAVQGI